MTVNVYLIDKTKNESDMERSQGYLTKPGEELFMNCKVYQDGDLEQSTIGDRYVNYVVCHKHRQRSAQPPRHAV